MRFLSGHESTVTSLAYCHEGRLLATGDGTGLVHVWDLVQGVPIGSQVFDEAVGALALFEEGPLLACALGQNQLTLWEVGRPGVRSLGMLWRLNVVRQLLFSRDGGRVIITGDAIGPTLYLHWLGGQTLQRRGGHGLVLSPEGGNFATSGACGSIYVWHSSLPLDLPNADFRYKQRLTGHYRGVASVLAFSANGESLYSAVHDELAHWDLRTGLPLRPPPPPPAGERPLAFAPGGRLLLTCAEDVLFLRETASGRLLAALDWGLGTIRQAVFSPDGMTAAATGEDGRVVVWDVEE